jgi:putative transmembrane protein PGPGW
MLEKVKENWQQFKKSEPGHRFQDRYHRRQQNIQGQWNIGKLFNIVGGIVIALAGLFFMPAPGPGSAIIFVGLGLLGSESLSVARFLDWAEVRLRELAQQSKDIWTRSSIPVKILISLIILGCVAAIEYGAYHLLFSGSKR